MRHNVNLAATVSYAVVVPSECESISVGLGAMLFWPWKTALL